YLGSPHCTGSHNWYAVPPVRVPWLATLPGICGHRRALDSATFCLAPYFSAHTIARRVCYERPDGRGTHHLPLADVSPEVYLAPPGMCHSTAQYLLWQPKIQYLALDFRRAWQSCPPGVTCVAVIRDFPATRSFSLPRPHLDRGVLRTGSARQLFR